MISEKAGDIPALIVVALVTTCIADLSPEASSELLNRKIPHDPKHIKICRMS
jgi:hypothetical protein